MAQIIKHRRGTAAQLKTVTLQKAELGVSTGSGSGITTPVLHVGDGTNAAGFVVGRLFQGSTVPTLNSGNIGSALQDMLFHDSATYKLYKLNSGGNENLDLTGNIAGRAITGSLTLTGQVNVEGAATSTAISASGEITASNILASGTITGNSLVGTLTTAAQTNITSVGTIGTGTWEGTTIAVAQGGTGATTLNNLITLSTHTTGNYVATLTGGTGITSTGATSGEGIAHSISVDASQTQITSVGALDAGSITSNFGSINNGASTITTTGLISGGSLDIDDVVINGTTIGHTDDTDLMTVANGKLTVAGDLDVMGSTTFVSSSQVDIGDRIIELNATNAAGDGGIYVRDTDTAETGSLLWDVSTDRWIGGLKDAEVNLVTISSTDTLTNKTLTTPTIGNFSNATHTHADAANGGQITLGTGTTGNYVATAVAGTGISVSAATGNVTISSAITAGDGLTLNTADIDIDASQTTITSIKNAALVIGRDADNDIDFATDNNIIFRAGGEDQLTLVDGALTPSSNAIVDLGTDALEFKDAYFDGTLEADAITIAGTALNTVIAGVTVTNATTAAVATTVTISDNESTNEENAILFSAGADADGGNLGVEQDHSGLTYNPSTGTVTATGFSGNLTGTLQTAAQTNITSVGTIGTGTWQGTSIGTSYTDAKVTSIVAGDGIDVSGATGDVTVTAEAASATNPGVVELATSAETITGTDTTRAITADGLNARIAEGANGNISGSATSTGSFGHLIIQTGTIDGGSF